ncbi:general substrate transporter [Kockovaella imperatae]|uniref:Quinate transporter n=1 Tax=Kockovaella imperatae TaxID=4999 RepID=A0A1Y1UG98_9TREE|nr:general substrate transporter [Kockovaella imperatae]ORX37073.1 general substrate transporter [Kockovaella imperatae]
MVNLLEAFRPTLIPGAPVPPKEVVNYRIVLLGLFGAFCAILFGYDLGFIGGIVVLPSFNKDFNLADASAATKTAVQSNVVSVFQAGAVFGALFSSWAANVIGRRLSLLANLVLYLVGAAFMTGASGHAGVALLYLGRVLTGWGVGASTMLVPVYVAESAPAHVRGRLVGLYEVGVQFGTMVGFWIPYGVLTTQKGTIQWRLPFGLQLLIAAGAFVWLLFLSETPRYVASRDGEAKALAALAKLRGLPEDNDYVQHELIGIMEQVQMEALARSNYGSFSIVKESFGRHNIRPLYTGVLIMIFFQMAGTNAVNYYSPRIFASLGLSATSSKLFATGVYGVIRFVATTITMLTLTDRFGRKSMIIAGGSMMALCMWIVGALTKAYPPVAGHGMNGGQLGAIILIYIWAVAFCVSYAGIPWIYVSEIFPLRIRGFCVAICTATHWSFNLMLAKTTPYMLENLDGYGIYFVFAACTTIGAIWQFFCMPETKGKTLEEITESFGGAPVPREQWHRDEEKEEKTQIEMADSSQMA